jgi:hypothetical protein
MLKHYKQNGIRIEKAAKMDAAELQGKIVEGEFVNLNKPELIFSIAAALKEPTGGNK